MDVSVKFATPENAHLFEKTSVKKLEPERADEAHHIIDKDIFLCKRARPDILLAKGLLSTVLKATDIYGQNNIRNTMHYLWDTKTPP